MTIPTAGNPVPSDLRALEQWVLWRREDRNGKSTKVPYQPAAPHVKASSTDAATWASYQEAVRAARTADGIGFVFSDSDPFAGIDLDNCVTDGNLHPYVAELVTKLDSYTELSPSGNGLHIIVRASISGDRRRTGKTPWTGAFENYSTGRFFCVTGSPLARTPASVNDRQAELDAIRAELLPTLAPHTNGAQAAQPSPALTDDEELLNNAFGSANGEAFGSLWSSGDVSAYGGDHSRADLALCGMLAFWCGGPDRARIDRLFRRSKLMRAKWDDARGESTYGAQTIDKALDGRIEFYGGIARARARSGAGPAVEMTITDKGKLALPPVPIETDVAGHCAWLTCVFNLNLLNPITGGHWQGVRGPDGQIALHRADAPDIRFDPARAMNTAKQLTESFVGRKHTGDGMLHAFTVEHCRRISYVVQCLCDTSGAQTEQEEATGIIGTFMQGATAVDGHTTYGTAAQRYEAAFALRREVDDKTGRPAGPMRYVIDLNTGELVIAVGDLADAARRHVGSSLPRGWLDGRMANLGWDRARLDGHAKPGRAGRSSPHATVNVYRGHLKPVTE